jgi:hypothetical protein
MPMGRNPGLRRNAIDFLGVLEFGLSMSISDFFRARLGQMIDLRHPLAVRAMHIPWAQIEASLALLLARPSRAGGAIEGTDLLGPTVQVASAGVSASGSLWLPTAGASDSIC